MQKKNKSLQLLIMMGLLFVATVLAQTVNAEDAVIAEDIQNNADIPDKTKKLPIQQLQDPRSVEGLSGLPQTSCTDYYKFQSVQVSLGANKDVYRAGEAVQLSGELINQNSYPVVDGNVFARITKKNKNYVTEGNYIVDEMFLQENVALKEGETKAVDYQWSIPSGIADGDYRIDYFFSVGKKFNLGGLPFSNEVVIGATEFAIKSEQSGYLSFDRAKTTVNGEAYRHIGNWPVIEPDQGVDIKQPINNAFNRDEDVEITYNLFHWDSLNKGDLKDTKTENISIPGSSSKELEYKIPQMNDAVYYLQIIAQSGEDKSIVNIRVTSPQQNIRLNYPAITEFPINQGDSFTLFSCFHNGADSNSSGRVEVLLQDKNGDEVGKFEYKGHITSQMLAEKDEIIAKEDYDYLKLTAKTYDENDNLTDKYETVYDCKLFDACDKTDDSQSAGNMAMSGGPGRSLFISMLVISGIIAGALAVLGMRFYQSRRKLE